MTQRWLQQQERGSGNLIHLIAWLALTAGRPIGRALLHPICLYFLLSSPRARAASQAYLSRILGHPARLHHTYRHYHTFATTILDRVFFLSNRFEGYDLRIEGAEIVESLQETKRGCLLLGAHLGSFEVLRCLAVLKAELPVKVLMYPHNSRRLNAVLDALSPRLADNIIPLGQPDSMLRVKEWIDSGGMVGILGDRLIGGGKHAMVPFLDSQAPLPLAPVLLASWLKVPVVMFRGLHRGGRRYDVKLELFAERIELDRHRRDEQAAGWLAKYGRVLEQGCRTAPYNSFNFYDFWEAGDDPA